MNKHLSNFFSKCIAVMAIILGIYLMDADLAKKLPFGIIIESDTVLYMWGHIRLFVAAGLIGYGLLLFFRKPISRFIRKLPMMWK